MYSYQYPRPALTADIILIDKVRRMVLLICRKNEPFRLCWAFPGGFFDMSDASIEQTAQRELEEETGVHGVDLQLLTVASRENRDPRGRTVSVVFCGLVDSDSIPILGADDALEARWFSLDNLPSLAFDHGEILQKAINNVFKQ